MGPKSPDLTALSDLRQTGDSADRTFPTTAPLSMENVLLLRDEVGVYAPTDPKGIKAFIGIDIGSVSTNVVVIDQAGRGMTEI